MGSWQHTSCHVRATKKILGHISLAVQWPRIGVLTIRQWCLSIGFMEYNPCPPPHHHHHQAHTLVVAVQEKARLTAKGVPQKYRGKQQIQVQKLGYAENNSPKRPNHGHNKRSWRAEVHRRTTADIYKPTHGEDYCNEMQSLHAFCYILPTFFLLEWACGVTLCIMSTISAKCCGFGNPSNKELLGGKECVVVYRSTHH